MRSFLLSALFALGAIAAQAQPAATTALRDETATALKRSELPVPSADAVLAEAQAVAARENKKVMVLFHASWCGWCRKMEKAMDEPEMKSLFEKNYVIRWLTVYESANKKADENPGAEDLLKKYKGNDQGIPYFLFFDAKGNMLADSQKSPGENVGCPAEPDEVAHFVKVLKQTSKLGEAELAKIAERFRKNKGE